MPNFEMEKDDPYPTHTKLKRLNGANNTVGDFISWLGENGLTICRRLKPHAPGPDDLDEYVHEAADVLPRDVTPDLRESIAYNRLGAEFVEAMRNTLDLAEVYVPDTRSTEEFIAEVFGIDADKLEAEKRAMLAAMRKLNGAAA